MVEGQLGRRESALELIQKAAALQPSSADIANSLGVVLQDAGRLEEAESCYRRALALDPRYPDAHHNLGNALRDRRCFAEAERSYRQALALKPEYVSAHMNLGTVLNALDRPEEAEGCLRRALALRSDFAEAHGNLGVVLERLGRLDEAERCLREALRLKPDFADAHYNLANALKGLGRLEEAVQAYRRALELEPRLAEARYNLANALQELGRLEQAERAYRETLALQPRLAEAHNNLGNLLRNFGRLREAEQSFRRGLELAPASAEIHSSLIFALDLMESGDAQRHQRERREWYARHASGFAGALRAHDNRREPERRLRVGYVSADFRRHSACSIFGPVLLRHDRAAFEVFCYSGVKREDEVTALLRASAQGWRSTLRLSDEALAEQIRRDAIDILVDLSGHTQDNRLLLFTRKPAPVQVTAWGYATGTGVETIDYFLADPVLVPPPERAGYAEEVVDLPCCICYEPPAYLPELSPLPAAAGKPFTFGCVNRIEKISDRAIALWGRILSAAPAARVLFKDARLDDGKCRESFLRRLGAAGIGPERVRMLGNTPHAEHLQIYREVDLGLDPFPHGGGVSTAEALWMGVPVATLRGATPQSRLSASILTAVGLEDWIASSDADYVRIALQAARDLPGLAALRQGLRTRLAESAFGDAQRYTRAVELAYRAMWRRWCEKRT